MGTLGTGIVSNAPRVRTGLSLVSRGYKVEEGIGLGVASYIVSPIACSFLGRIVLVPGHRFSSESFKCVTVRRYYRVGGGSV